jgi:hypothetical protein
MILVLHYSDSAETMVLKLFVLQRLDSPLPIISLTCLQVMAEVAASRNNASKVQSAVVSICLYQSLSFPFSAVSQSF